MIKPNHEFSYQGADYSTPQLSDSLPRHRWYLIKEGFAPKLVNAAIDSVSLKPSDLVLDPFSGCGTVALTASQRGFQALGIEVNPFLGFVSKTKLSCCDPFELLIDAIRTLHFIENSQRRPCFLENYSTFCVVGEKRGLFNKSILRAFAAGWNAVATANLRTSRFLRLALLKAAMDNCNAKADGKCLRYRKDWNKVNLDVEDFIQSFMSHIDTIVRDIKITELPGSADIVVGDSRAFLKRDLSKKFRLCITSPPYLNSFDYSDIYRPEMFLGGFVEDTYQLRQIRLKTVRSHIQARWAQPTETDFGPLYQSVARDLIAVQTSLWDARIPIMVQAYFEDMKNILRRLHTCACSDAQIWLVVSTSAYGGVEIPVDLILANIGEQVGWNLCEVGVIRRLRHASHHWGKLAEDQRAQAKLRESVVVLSRSRK